MFGALLTNIDVYNLKLVIKLNSKLTPLTLNNNMKKTSNADGLWV